MMIETDNYWISDNKFIFKPSFNGSIHDYMEFISEYKELIFSDYEDINNTNMRFDFCIYTICSIFNKIIRVLPLNLTDIKFGRNFNQPIILPHGLTCVTFGDKFDQPVNLPHDLTCVTFGDEFNQPVNLPPNLTRVIFGRKYSHTINLPPVLYLRINSSNNVVDMLPNNIEELELGTVFKLPLNNLPCGLKKLIFNSRSFIYSTYNHELNMLPNSIEYLELPTCYKKQIKNFPLNLETIVCHKEYKFIKDFKKYKRIIKSERGKCAEY